MVFSTSQIQPKYYSPSPVIKMPSLESAQRIHLGNNIFKTIYATGPCSSCGK